MSSFHHRPSLTQSNKSFKGSGRHASARELRRRTGGRVGIKQSETSASSRRRHALSSSANSREAERSLKRRTLVEAARSAKVSSKTEPPSAVLLIPITRSANANRVRRHFIEVCEQDPEALRSADSDDGDGVSFHAETRRVPRPLSSGAILRATFLSVDRPHRDVLDDGATDAENLFLRAVMDSAKVADLIVLVFCGDEELEERDRQLLQMLRAQGVPSVASVSYPAPVSAAADEAMETAAPRKSQARAERRERELRMARARLLAAESMGDGEAKLRPHPIEFEDRGASSVNALRLLLPQLRKAVLPWRANRSYMLVESVERSSDAAAAVDADGRLVCRLTGYLRGAPTSAGRLVHVTDVGTFAARRILAAEDRCALSREQRAAHVERPVWSARSAVADAEDVESAAEVDPMAGEQTWPDEDDEGADEEAGKVKTRRRLRPKGWSEYQAAWIAEDDRYKLGDVDDDGDGMRGVEDAAGDGSEEREEDEEEELEAEDTRIEDQEEDVDMDLDDEELNEEELRKLREEDAKFPDEVEVPTDRPARERFAKYRGLRSFRTSPWDPKESLPREYATVHQFADFVALRKRVLRREAAGEEDAVVPVGAYVVFEVEGVDPKQLELMRAREQSVPLILSSLHRFENKRTVVHAGLLGTKGLPDGRTESDRASTVSGGTNGSAAGAPVMRSKDEITLQVGFVRFPARALLSEMNANTDKHKLERFLQPGGHSCLSAYGPAVFPPAPAVAFNAQGALIGTGSLLGADPDRIILKRIVITGYPFRIHKRKAVVRFMFFTPEDIRWFKPVELWTKLGRAGHILEPLGTHGYMKCIFDGPIQHHDTVCMNLYKRVFPKMVDDN